MYARLLLLLTVTALVALTIFITHAWAGRQTMRLRSGSVSALWDALGARPDGRPTMVAFSTKACGVCRTAQQPALEAVERSLGLSSVRILKIDAAARPDVVKAFSVMTAPSTALFAADGRLCAINRGFATADRLIGQLRQVRAGEIP